MTLFFRYFINRFFWSTNQDVSLMNFLSCWCNLEFSVEFFPILLNLFLIIIICKIPKINSMKITLFLIVWMNVLHFVQLNGLYRYFIALGENFSYQIFDLNWVLSQLKNVFPRKKNIKSLRFRQFNGTCSLRNWKSELEAKKKCNANKCNYVP